MEYKQITFSLVRQQEQGWPNLNFKEMLPVLLILYSQHFSALSNSQFARWYYWTINTSLDMYQNLKFMLTLIRKSSLQEIVSLSPPALP